TWVTANGELWMFGGNGYGTAGTSAGMLNDLWKYDEETETWTWIAGSGDLDVKTSYGQVGVSSPSSQPGARTLSTAWVSTTGTLMLFGGQGPVAGSTSYGTFNDLWQFDIPTSTWTWVGGTSASMNQGNYGTK